MKSKNYFKVTLFSMKWLFVKDVATLANYINSGAEQINIEGLGFYARTQLLPYTKGTFSVTVSGNKLTIDKGTENLLLIEEREELELEVPTLTAQEAKGILDENNSELLN